MILTRRKSVIRFPRWLLCTQQFPVQKLLANLDFILRFRVRDSHLTLTETKFLTCVRAGRFLICLPFF